MNSNVISSLCAAGIYPSFQLVLWMEDSEKWLDEHFAEASMVLHQYIELFVMREEARRDFLDLLRNTGHIPVRTQGEFIFPEYRFAMPSNFTIPAAV